MGQKKVNKYPVSHEVKALSPPIPVVQFLERIWIVEHVTIP